MVFPYRFAHLILIAAVSGLFRANQVRAEALISFADGTQLKSEELLAQGKALIYIDKDCSACKRYILDLKTCETAIQEAVVLVSINTAAQTKEMARSLPRGFPLHLLKNRRDARSLDGTPTTKSSRGQKLGPLKCDDLKRLFAPEPIAFNQ